MKNKRVLLFLMSVVLGAFFGVFVGMFKAGAESYEIILDVKVLIPWISAICLLIGFISILLTFNFLKKSRKFHSLYQEETLLCDRLSLLNKGNLIEYGSPQEIIQKYHVDKKVRLCYQDGREQVVSFEELPHLDTTDLIAVHSCEPTLEEIFIRLTGEKLDV